MRAVVQRVKQAQVHVDGELVGQTGPGVMALIGVKTDDTAEDASTIASKIVNLRIFDDTEGRMNLSLLESGGSALLVSQFTLYGDARKGRRPSYIEAAEGEKALGLFEKVCELVGAAGVLVETGKFGHEMEVSLVNHGPVTILLESRKLF